jgi:hypothetical protein
VDWSHGWLIALVWAIYVVDSFVRLPAGAWIFRGTAIGRLRGTATPDLPLGDGRLALALLPLWPFGRAFVVSGGSFDTDALRRKLDEYLQATDHLSVAATGLAAALLLAFPLLAITGRLSAVAPSWAVMTVLLWIATLALYFRAHWQLHGEAPSSDTWLPLVVSPLSLVRAPIVLGAQVFAQAHPAAAAALWSPPDECRRVWRLLAYDEPQLRSAVEALGKAGGHDPSLQPLREPDDVDSLRYCPRCGGLYREQALVCGDCGGVRLAAFDRTTGTTGLRPRDCRPARLAGDVHERAR